MLFKDKRVLLTYPELITETWLGMASSIYFMSLPIENKPCMIELVDNSTEDLDIVVGGVV